MSKAIIDELLYDTDVSAYIMTLEEVPPTYTGIYFGGCTCDLYQGKKHWFVDFMGSVYPVDEDWVKSKIGRVSVEKYTELFGTVETA